MKKAKNHPFENQRVEALKSLNLLDTVSESDFDELTFLASKICETPIALVSLIDSERQWFKSKQGLTACETPRDVAFCAHAILNDELFIVEDSSKDERFFDNPLVTGDPRVMFYAGIPLHDPIHKLPIGTLCVIDNSPKKLSDEQKKSLLFLSRQVERLLSARIDLINLTKTKAQLEEAQSIAKIGSWDFDIQTKKISWSDQMFELFSENIELGPPSFEKHKSSIIEEDRTLWEETVKKCIQDGEPYSMRFRTQNIEQQMIWIEAFGRGLKDSGGQIKRLLGTCQDITEKVKLEADLNQKNLLALHNSKLATLGEMAAGMAHEINNPLSIVVGNLTFLKTYRDNEEKFNAKITSMEKASERITKIVQGLRKFSRFQTDLHFDRLELESIILESIGFLESASRGKGITVEWIDKKPMVIEAHQIEIEQVILNLFTNAFDAIKNLDEKWIKLRLFTEKNEAVFQIQDSGFGLTYEIERKIFEPFFTTKPVGEGTGLGLAICKGIVDQHKGKLLVNRSFKNTCFELRLPLSSDQNLNEVTEYKAS